MLLARRAKCYSYTDIWWALSDVVTSHTEFLTSVSAAPSFFLLFWSICNLEKKKIKHHINQPHIQHVSSLAVWSHWFHWTESRKLAFSDFFCCHRRALTEDATTDFSLSLWTIYNTPVCRRSTNCYLQLLLTAWGTTSTDSNISLNNRIGFIRETYWPGFQTILAQQCRLLEIRTRELLLGFYRQLGTNLSFYRGIQFPASPTANVFVFLPACAVCATLSPEATADRWPPPKRAGLEPRQRESFNTCRYDCAPTLFTRRRVKGVNVSSGF